MDRITELGMQLADALKRGDLETAGRLAAEQRALIQREYAERVRVTLAADSF
jgi:hypothetical protein